MEWIYIWHEEVLGEGLRTAEPPPMATAPRGLRGGVQTRISFGLSRHSAWMTEME